VLGDVRRWLPEEPLPCRVRARGCCIWWEGLRIERDGWLGLTLELSSFWPFGYSASDWYLRGGTGGGKR